MDTDEQHTDEQNAPDIYVGRLAGNRAAVLGRVVGVVLVLALLGGAGYVAYYLMTHKKAPRRKGPTETAALVEVSRVSVGTEPITVRVMGVVIPARTMELASRVSGHILTVSGAFEPGGQFAKGTKILQVDPKDYELLVPRRVGELATATHDLKVEKGEQSVARREYELLAAEVRPEDKELLLREPQLVMAIAAVSAAEAAKEKAELDLERTDVLSPFNAAIQSRSVNEGSEVAVGTPLASLVGTDKYWVRVSVPMDQLKWIHIPGFNSPQASTVRIYHKMAWGPTGFRAGTVERLMTDLEPEGRMAQLLVKVADPLHLKVPLDQRRQLILGAYVRAEITGRDLPDVVRLPRTALRDGKEVWVMRRDRTLDIREVEIVWGGDEHVCVCGGLGEGDLLIVSDLPAPVAGMALRTAKAADTQPEGGR